jgi:hypothetical protein
MRSLLTIGLGGLLVGTACGYLLHGEGKPAPAPRGTANARPPGALPGMASGTAADDPQGALATVDDVHFEIGNSPRHEAGQRSLRCLKTKLNPAMIAARRPREN